MTRTRLDVLLVDLRLFESRAKAQAAIEAGQVLVDGVVARRVSERVAPDADIQAGAAHPWVSRAALKLEHALALWPVAVANLVVLDVGASTGGFTEVCLSRGAARVYAVDVGREQLHPRLIADPRVVSLEATDARALDASLIPQAPDLVVCDASFIGLAKVLPAALDLARPAGSLIALVKPQFEVGPARVGKGGVVKDPAAQEDAVAGVSAFLESRSWSVRSVEPSPILGADGNREFLLWAEKSGA